MAHADLSRAGFTGQFGFAIVEPEHEPGIYDQEVCLAAHHWEPSLAHMGPPDNGWEIAYRSAELLRREPLLSPAGEMISGVLRILTAGR